MAMKKTNHREIPSPRRLAELDSLRGLAALTVLMHHILLTFPTFAESNTNAVLPMMVRLLKYSPLHLIWAGHEAVILFFVLSGFVLFLPFKDKRAPPAHFFILKRICRIWLPCLFCIFAVVMVNRLGLDRNPSVDPPFTGAAILSSVVLIGLNGDAIYAPLWSLIHEMRISIIFPWLAPFILNARAWITIALSIAASVLAFLLMRTFQEYGATRTDSLVMSLNFLPAFTTGMLLAKYQNHVVGAYARLSSTVKIGIFAVAVLLYTAPFGIFLRVPKMQGFLCGWATVIGAAAFIIVALGSAKSRKLLLIAPIRFLGTVSYSLYLLHGIALGLAVHCLSSVMPIWSVMVVGAMGSIAMAGLGYKLIEAPSIRLAQKFGKQRLGSDLIAKTSAP
jgi:peptidoglycan/LPS O-acetylase OafA/YrhL